MALCFLDESIEKLMDYMAHNLWEVTSHYCKPKFMLHIPLGLPSRVVLKKYPTIPANMIRTYHMGFHVDFPSIEMLKVVVHNHSHVNLKWGPMTLSTNESKSFSRAMA